MPGRERASCNRSLYQGLSVARGDTIGTSACLNIEYLNISTPFVAKPTVNLDNFTLNYREIE